MRAHLDTSMERNTLMATVYPKIKDYCREKHGLEFQVNLILPFIEIIYCNKQLSI